MSNVKEHRKAASQKSTVIFSRTPCELGGHLNKTVIEI